MREPPRINIGITFAKNAYGNRIYAELGFVRPDGSIHRALAYVDMGSSSMTLRESLFNELQLDLTRWLTFKVGDFSVVCPAAKLRANAATFSDWNRS